MKTTAQVVVIGGGVVGCSVLYHLTKLGWKDVLLIERRELTAGSTWHAAGGFHTLNSDTNMATLQGYTIRLYKELEEITGQSCGLHHVGGMTIATDSDRMDSLKAEVAKHRHMGLDTRLVTAAEIKELCPVINTGGILGGMYDPLDGHLDPSGTTQAYAKAARMGGAEIVQHNRVLELNPRSDGTWDVVTEQGTVHTEYVVNCGGLWAREVGEMVGLNLPVHAMEHQYLVTDDIKEVYERDTELPHVVDPAGESYFRQEGRGLVLGTYEQRCEPWAVDGTSWDFGSELLADKLDRIEESLEMAYNRYPCLAEAGIKRVINGPFTFSPDGNPLMGPVPGLPGYWTACAVMAGFSQAGGVGLSLAEWMIEGEASRDVFAMDVARFGTYCTKPYTRATVIQNYQQRFSVPYPNDELPAGRPLKTSPAYGIWKEQNAVFGHGYGMEHVNYFASEGEPTYETPTFRRSNAFDAVKEECRVVREAVGINETHNFSKYEVTGPGAIDWLNTIMAGRMPKEGRISLSPMLAPSGKLIGDFTMARLGPDRVQLTASYGAQGYHMRWFQTHLPTDGSVELRNVSDTRIGFQIAGPNARELLSRVTRSDVSNDAFKFLDVREIEIGMLPAIVCRVSFSGGLGYEIFVEPAHQIALYHTLVDAGSDLGLKPFGMRAMMSLRLEKGFGSWMREYKPDYTPGETGLDRFINFKKEDFIGREAAILERDDPDHQSPRKLMSFIVDALDADVNADEPIWKGDDVVGYVTSGGYAHYSEKSFAFGFVPRELANQGEEFEIEILGHKCKAVIETTVLFDPEAKQMRD